MPRFQLMLFSEDKNKGLWVNGPRENTPKNFWRRQTGSHAIRERELRSRDGTTVDTTVPIAHSLSRFDDLRFQAAGTSLFRSGVSISTGLDGTPLDLIVSEPRTGTDAEYLFHCGGGRLEKVDSAGVVTQWGIDPPAGGNWGTSPGGTGEDDTETIVIDPQEKTIVDTTTLTPAGTGGWFTFPASPGPFISTDNVQSASGSAVCMNVVPEENEEIDREENGLI